MSDVSDEVSLEPDSAQVSSVRLGVEGECVVVVRMDWWRGERQGQAVPAALRWSDSVLLYLVIYWKLSELPLELYN